MVVLAARFSLSEDLERLATSTCERLRLSLECEGLLVRFPDEESREDSLTSLAARRWELALAPAVEVEADVRSC